MNRFVSRLITIPLMDGCKGATLHYIMSRDGYICSYCGLFLKRGTRSREHVIPTSRGGSDAPVNVVPACVACNSGKRNDTLMELTIAGRFTPRLKVRKDVPVKPIVVKSAQPKKRKEIIPALLTRTKPKSYEFVSKNGIRHIRTNH